MKKPITLSESGSIQTGEKEVIPKRSWRKGDGGYNAKFEWEGATIYVAFPEDWEAIQSTLKQMQADAKTARDVADSYKGKSEDEIPQEELEAVEQKAKQSLLRQRDFFNDVIAQCVIGWKDAPFPFSAEVRDGLSSTIKSEWLAEIFKVSQLDQAEANFLGK